MKSARRPRQLLILLIDVGVLFLSLFLALVVRYRSLPSEVLWWTLVTSFMPSWIFWIIAFYTANLYNIESAFDEFRFVGRLFAGVAVGALLSALIFYLGSFSQTPKTILALYTVSSLS